MTNHRTFLLLTSGSVLLTFLTCLLMLLANLPRIA